MSDNLPAKRVELTPEQVSELEAALEKAQQAHYDAFAAADLIKHYQRVLNMLGAPDPRIVEANEFLRKHGVAPEQITHMFRVYVDGRDITEHPDSIPGTVVEELEAGDD